ncbi:esterase-like protein [Gloeothece citriformis PCC 7424]|uniref:Esterase-like protein n=1 Tax=Gloeothece citriformis (strain PCC 7424) TaxID=65393 RepID=B7KB01_GLOC7|nr:prolyl oligopeptidase family serine peptidase [Gloeothece citriformis]ACK70111.1 esterase-like protein [Gloeothece citriformis PCC 7424]
MKTTFGCRLIRLYLIIGVLVTVEGCSTHKLLPVITHSRVSNKLTQQPPQKSISLSEESSTPISESLQRQQNPLSEFKSMTVTNAVVGWNQNLSVDNVEYDLYIPPNYESKSNRILPCLLVLPGWNFKRTSWIENSRLVEYADQYGYGLILPEMGKTLYESRYYPQTTLKWHSLPGGQFMKVFIREIQQRHNLLKPGQHNTLLGLSTGGRGVALIALENPDLFVAGASLSGDFSQENMKNDRLMTAVYGAYKQFPERWKGQDNPQARIAEWKMPLYLAHGMRDNIVPESQSRLFYNALKQYHQDNLRIVYHPVAGAGHDYQFWGGELESVFQFFEEGN